MSFWRKTYSPRQNENRFRAQGDFESARERFYRKPHSNLRYLVKKRYEWMNPYLAGKQHVVELGAGPGLSREFLDVPRLELTDVIDNDWIDSQVDATALPYADGSVDAVICSHMIHHVATPAALIARIQDILSPGGVLLINETRASLLHRLLMWSMRHEGWSYEVDLFDKNAAAKTDHDPLAGNNAVGSLLFNDHKRFETVFPGLSIVHDEFTETFLFLLSGGVGVETFTIELPEWALSGVGGFDRLLSRYMPGVFSLARRVVVVKGT